MRHDIDCYLVEDGAFHLRCDGALPDQLIEPQLIAIEPLGDGLGPAEKVGWADRFVRLLSVLGGAFIDSGGGGQIFRAEP